jgi:hypothetical protein
MLSFKRSTRGVAIGAVLALAAAPLAAQSRVLPAGTVILVRTTTVLDSRTAQVGQTFETTVEQDVGIDAYSVVPTGSRIRGTITMSRAATRSQSGVIDVHFDRLTFTDGSSVTINGKLTSTDSAERRQINADPNAHVVLLGQRGGIGATIAGAGGSQNPNSILSALGGLLSEGRDVAVPAGTQLAVELIDRVSLRGRGRIAASAAGSTIYTATDIVSSAQRALAQRNYYRGTANGMLDNATRRALFAFQIDNGMTGTGNLDGRTAQLLGLSLGATTGASMTSAEATALRRDAQTVLTRERSALGINNNFRGQTGRNYSQAELEVLFALSAFVDNSTMYEQIVRAGPNEAPAIRAGRAVLNAARRVDAAIAADGSVNADVRAMWSNIRRALTAFEAANPG